MLTYEQTIRNLPEDGNLQALGWLTLADGLEVKVISDYEGVLETEVILSGVNLGRKFLNGNTFYNTHEEAFKADL